MLVTIIIVAYNAQEVLNNILDNIIEQDYQHKKIEVLLVDSASKDSTRKIMLNFFDNYFCEFNRVCVLDNPKKTLPCGWNVALKESNGEVIIRVDAHAKIPSNFISNNISNIRNNESICGGKVTSVSVNSNEWQKMLLCAENSIFGGGIAKFRRKESRGYVDTLAFAAYKRCVFEKVGGYNENLARTEDNEIHYRMRRAGYKFLFDPNIQSYRQSRDSFFKLMKQKYLNGYWVGLTLGVSPKCFSFYHLLPFAFLLGIITTSLLAFFRNYNLLILMWTTYWSLNIMLSLFTVFTERINKMLLLLPLVLFLLHISYGIGTFIGLVKMPVWKPKNSYCSEIEEVKTVLTIKSNYKGKDKTV